MVAPGQRVLVLECGAGLGAMLAASRGATVVAVDGSEAALAAARANVDAAGLSAEVTFAPSVPADCEPFDLVFERGGAMRSAEELSSWLGETGRLLRLVPQGSGRDRAPTGFRAVRLARSPGFFAPFEVLSIGWDLEAARTERHRARGSDDATRRASVSRRRWEGEIGAADAPGSASLGGAAVAPPLGEAAADPAVAP